MIFTPEDNVISIRIEKSCGLLVSVQEGDQAVPYDQIKGRIHINEFEGSGRARTWSRAEGAMRIGVANPGLYVIRMDTLEGYEPTEPTLVQVPYGEWVRHVVALHRSR